jgi:Protein of unknown function (DUF3300)
MNDFSRFFPLARRTMRGFAAATADSAKRSIALALAGLMVPLGVAPLAAYGQEAPPPPPDQQAQPTDQAPPPPDQEAPPPPDQAPPQQYNALSPDQLNQLVAPIALYPDSLVAQVLAAATYPTQVADADHFDQANQGAPPEQLSQMANGQPWDPSVKALTAFPTVLSQMDKNLDWTTQLGNAYYNQPQDVMNAVQTDRQQAYDSGKLRSTPQEYVQDTPGDVVIEPTNPAVVYVPYYNPWTVWGWGNPWFAWYAPPPPPGFFMGVGIGFGFGFGIAIGAWSHWGWGWGHWGVGWGPHPWIGFHGGMWVSHSVTVINHGYYGRFERNPAARAYNYHAAVAAHGADYNHAYYNGARAGFNAGARAGYNAGARTGYNAGARAGYNNGVNRGTTSNYRAPAANSYRAPAANNYRAPATNNYRAPAANSYRAPAANNYRAPASRPAQNYSRPAPQSRPSGGGGHPAAAPHGGGGGGHPAAAPHGGGGGHPHGR